MPQFITLPDEVAAVLRPYAKYRTAIAEVRSEISELRSEMKADFSSVQKEITGLHGQIAGLHREISAQTKWILAGLAAAVTLYPTLATLVVKLIP